MLPRIWSPAAVQEHGRDPARSPRLALLGVGGLLALPIFSLPAILAGAPISPGLVHTALLGIAGFVLFAVFAAVLLLTDWPLAVTGRATQSLRNRTPAAAVRR